MNRAMIEACWPWALLLAVSFAAAWLLVRVSGARLRLDRLRRLHANQTGGVQSLSFVLTFPLFTMVMMFIVQVSQLMIGQIVVHYAAFSAARSAMVWIPANLGMGYEIENCISTISPMGSEANGTVYQVAPGSPKYQQIEYAAAQACLSIAPSRQTPFSLTGDASQALSTIQLIYGNLAPGSKSNPKINPRLSNKLAYSLANTSINMTIWHYDNPGDNNSELPLQLYPPNPDLEIPPKPDIKLWERPDLLLAEFQPNEIGWKDPITVTVTHQFALMPGPGRLLAKFAAPAGSGTDPIAARIRQSSGLHVYPISASATLGNEGEKPVAVGVNRSLTYVQRMPSAPTAGSSGGGGGLSSGGGS